VSQAEEAPSLDEDFDAVVEIDLDDLDDEEFAQAEPPEQHGPSDLERAMAEAEASVEAPAAGDELQGKEEDAGAGFLPSRHWYLRTDRGTIYAFLTAELLVRWARRLSRKPAALAVSTDEEAWQPLPVFIETLAQAGSLPEDLHVDVEALAADGGSIVSDADLEASLRAEAATYDAEPAAGEKAPAAAHTGKTGPQSWPVDAKSAAASATERATPTPAVEASAQRVGDFTFKVSEVTESAGGRYFLLLLVGLLLGAGGALLLSWLGMLPPFPF